MGYSFGAGGTNNLAPASIVETAQRTLFVRVRPNAANTTRREIFTALNTTDFQFHVFACFDTFGTNRFVFGFTANNGADLRVTGWDTGFSAGTDHYLFGVYDQSTLAIYADQDTSAKATNSFSDTPDVGGMALRIGNHAFDTSQSWDGVIYEVAWYDVALTSDERQLLGMGYSPLFLNRMPVMYWPFRDNAQEIIGQVSTTVTGASFAAEAMNVIHPASVQAHVEPVPPASIIPVGIASLEAFGTAILKPQQFIVDAGGIATAAAFGTAVLKTGLPVLPSGVASLEAFGTALLLPQPRTLLLTGVASAEAFGTTSFGQGVSTVGVGSAELFGTPILDLGPRTVLPSGAASDAAFGSAQVLRAPAFLAASGVASLETWGSPTIQVGSVTLVMSGAASSLAFGVPHVGEPSLRMTKAIRNSGIGKVSRPSLGMGRARRA